MILIYTVVVLILAIASWLFQRRVARLERKFSRVAKQTHQVALEPAFKPGTRLDACQIAKRQYQLGQLVQKRDALEARHATWQARADRLTGWSAAVRNWRGRKLPYTAGVIDVWMLLCLLDYLGAGEYVNAREAVRWLTGLIRGG